MRGGALAVGRQRQSACERSRLIPVFRKCIMPRESPVHIDCVERSHGSLRMACRQHVGGATVTLNATAERNRR